MAVAVAVAMAVAVAVAVAVAAVEEEEVAEDGLEPLDQEQVPRHFCFLEAMGRCMGTPPEYSKETRLKQERLLGSGIDTGVSTTSPTLCISPTLAP